MILGVLFASVGLYAQDAEADNEEKDLTGQVLYKTISGIINDGVKLSELSRNALSLGNPQVMQDIIEAVENI